MNESSMDLMRLTMERDLERMKGEVANAKAELEAVKAGLAQQVADAKVQIGDHAIDKMYKVLLLGIALVVTVGGFSFYQLYAGARQTIESKITDWLSFDKKGALLKDSLEDIRMRVVLDGAVTRMTRSAISGAFHGPLEFTAAEKSRLVTYILDPNVSEMDFRDGARVLAAHIGLFYRGTDTKIDDLLSKTMSRFRVDSYRPVVLLQTLKHYPSIGHYASRILESKDIPNDLREAAFNALTESSVDQARKYAMEHLLDEQDPSLQIGEARALVGWQAAQGLIDQWLAKQVAKKSERIAAQVMLADSLSSQISPLSYDDSQRKWKTDRTAALLVSAIVNGAKLNFNSRAYPKVDLGFQVDEVAIGIRQPQVLFDRSNTLMAAMAKTASSASVPAETFVRALTTSGTRGEIFGLSVVLNSASLTGETFGAIDAASTAGPLLLVASDNASTPSVQVSFRAKDGRWVTDQVKSFRNLYSADLAFAYDEGVLQMARSRNSGELLDAFLD